jgi:hypothetical protein
VNLDIPSVPAHINQEAAGKPKTDVSVGDEEDLAEKMVGTLAVAKFPRTAILPVSFAQRISVTAPSTWTAIFKAWILE